MAAAVLIPSTPLPADKSGVLVAVRREQAGWQTLDFEVRRLVAGQSWQDQTRDQEAVFVILGGRFTLDFGAGPRELGGRAHVFAGYPHAAYLPPGTAFEITALTSGEFALAQAPSSASGLAPRLIRPEDVGCEIRGGGNATRQILDLLPPSFPADRLMVCEVYAPSGNWSSYPPHKHDVHSPPSEVDLDEVYYYRLSHPDGYALQRLYDYQGHDQTLRAGDGDLILIRDGYHPVVTAFGYDSYYLNVLAGSARSMAASDDPRYAHLRQWPPADPRLPVVHR
ncbi:MAG: 5-deoxy-glucuronate isomerase [Terriglobales bacterium]